MRNIDFHDIDEAMLRGDWVVGGRVLHRADPGSPIARAVSLKLGAGELAVMTATESVAGRWAIVRDDGLGRRPYLELELGDHHGRALITRLRQTDDHREGRLSLYTHDGLELELERQSPGQ
jgi:hypothetical protein